MRVTVEFHAQLRRAAGTGREVVELPGEARVSDLLGRVAAAHGEGLAGMLLGPEGTPRPSILLFVNDQQEREPGERVLQEGDRVLILSPVSGG